MIPRDTSEEAHKIQMALLRKMTGTARVDLLATMSAQTRETTRAGIRSRHPDYTEEQVQLAFSRIILGKHLFREVFPGQDIKP